MCGNASRPSEIKLKQQELWGIEMTHTIQTDNHDYQSYNLPLSLPGEVLISCRQSSD